MVTSEADKTEGSTPTSGGPLRKWGGSRHGIANVVLRSQALNTLWLESDDAEMREAFSSTTLALMEDIAPRDAIEALLATQIIGTHNLAMKCQALAVATETPEKMGDYVSMATKAGRSFSGLVNTLNRHRGKAPAQFKVGRVNVSEGGQAIVGVVPQRGEAPAGRKPSTKIATIADQPSASMRSAHPEAEAVPITTGSREDPLPDARRRSGERSANREPECLEARPRHGGSDCDEAGITHAVAQEPELDREPASVADREPAPSDDCDKPCEWSSAPITAEAGPSYFPRVGLGWTIQHIHDLHRRTRIRHQPVSIADAVAPWDLYPESRTAVARIDALLAFGFIEQSGEGSECRIRITEAGLRFVEDPDQKVHRQIMAEAGRKPKLIADYLERWDRTRPADDLCVCELETAHGFTDEEAQEFLRVYDDTYHLACEPEPFEPPEPLPQFAGRGRRSDPAQDPWTKWLPELEAYGNEIEAECNAIAE